MAFDLVDRFRIDFARSADSRREQDRINQFNIAEREKEQKKEKNEEKQEQDFVELLQSTALATETQVIEFEAKLDNYDRATVEALIKNAKNLEIAQKRVDEILEQAYVLPDGRRVFLTKDGRQVFDEHGVEVKTTEVAPEEIDPRLERWETFKAERDARDAIIQERQELLEYQDKLDKSRERIRSDEPLSAAELKEMDEDLERSMPETVKRGLTRQPEPEPKTAIKPESMELSMDELDGMRENAPIRASTPKAATPVL